MKSWLPHAGAIALLPFALPGASVAAADRPPIYAGLQGELLLENTRVIVEKFVVAPGQSTGRHTRPGDQLLVFVRGGTLRSLTTGRATLWRDGRVLWQSPSDAPDEGSRNVGSTPVVMIWVTLKPSGTAGVSAGRQAHYLDYPNIPGEDLLENERLIVQRFTVNPGQWEGVHAHGPNMLYIHIKGGQWAARSRKEPEHRYPDASPDGEVGWMAPIDISEGHESGNVGNQPIDLIWVTLKD